MSRRIEGENGAVVRLELPIVEEKEGSGVYQIDWHTMSTQEDGDTCATFPDLGKAAEDEKAKKS